MNSLTKTDLLTILKCLRITEREYMDHPDIDNAKGKIQRMIDDYCEHDRNGSEVEDFLDSCSKCNARILRD